LMPKEAGSDQPAAKESSPQERPAANGPPKAAGAKPSPGTKQTTRSREGTTVNAETAQVLRDADGGKNLIHSPSLAAMFEGRGIRGRREHVDRRTRMMRSSRVRSENPHFVPCPNGSHDPVVDMYAELLEPADRVAVAKGQAALLCPLCGQAMYWPRTFLNDPVPAPADLPVVYWSLAIWNRRPADKQQEALSGVPNLTRFLR
jgi:hypothetical protein